MESVWRQDTVAYAWSLWWPEVIVGLLALPLGLVFATWLTRRRRAAGWDPGWALRATCAETVMVVGTLPWLLMTLTPNPGQPRGHNLIPLEDLYHQFHVGIAYAILQIGGNLLVFAALGAGMPVRWRVGPPAALAAGAIGSTIIETLQWVLDLGRFSSVDDILVNAVGAGLAALVSYRWWRRRSTAQGPLRPMVGSDPSI